jgi:hypothetical protein
LDWWTGVLLKFRPDTMALAPVAAYIGPHIIERSSAQCSRSLIQGGVCLLLAAGLLALAKSRRRIACVGMPLMALTELACFAQTSLMTFQISPAYPPGILSLLAQEHGDYRIQYDNPNSAMTAGTLDIGGQDPAGLLRYIRYLDFTRGIDFDTAPYAAQATRWDAWSVRMLRCRYAFSQGRSDYSTVKDPLPRLLLVDRFRVMTNYHEIFSTLTNASFHVEEEVILESRPDPAPKPAREKGTVRILESPTDYLTIEADANVPSLLLMTDAYSSGWRALALPGSSQARYQIMPANYCLRAIPLAAGRHLLRIEYSPLGFRIGKVVSIVAWPIFIALAGLAIGNHRRTSSRV